METIKIKFVVETANVLEIKYDCFVSIDKPTSKIDYIGIKRLFVRFVVFNCRISIPE